MDTIFALASAPGKAGVAVIRLSGPHAFAVAEMLVGELPEPRKTCLRKIRTDNGEFIDEGLIVAFKGPNSFTGEDIVEFHTHGSPAVISSLQEALARHADLRLADPGEFTRRALENNRLDLAQVEGLADLIEAETEAQRKQAARTFSGELGEKVEEWRSDLVRAIALLELTIDFADEEVPEDVNPEVSALLSRLLCSLDAESQGSYAAERVRHGFEVAIIGAPNVGKSSLLNRLAKRDAAITSHVAGTTRDVVEVRMDLNGLPVTFLDTAGLRETEDVVEKIGIERALARAESADMRVVLTETGSAPTPIELDRDDLVVQAKSDIYGDRLAFSISAKTGNGVAGVINEIVVRLSARAAGIGTATHLRHRIALEAAQESLRNAEQGISQAFPVELVIEDLRRALVNLESLLGRVGVEQILDEIFSSFCLGK